MPFTQKTLRPLLIGCFKPKSFHSVDYLTISYATKVSTFYINCISKPITAFPQIINTLSHRKLKSSKYGNGITKRAYTLSYSISSHPKWYDST